MDGQKQDGQLEPTYSSDVRADTGCSTEDRPKAMDDKGDGERGSGISALMARHDDDDDLFAGS